MTGGPSLPRFVVEARVKRGQWQWVAEFSEWSSTAAIRKARDFGRIPARLAACKLRARRKEAHDTRLA